MIVKTAVSYVKLKHVSLVISNISDKYFLNDIKFIFTIKRRKYEFLHKKWEILIFWMF